VLIAALVSMGSSLAALVSARLFWPDAVTACAIGCVLISLATGILYWRRRNRRDTGMAISGAGALAVVLCLEYVPSGQWPFTVEGAVEEVHGWLSAEERRELAYRHRTEMVWLHMSLGADIRFSFGMYGGNGWLLRDCPPEHGSPDDCSAHVIDRLRERLRSELPAAELAAILAHESRIERVQLPAREFRDAPLPDVVAFLQAAIDEQLPASDRLRIEIDPEAAPVRITAKRDAMNLADWLSVIESGSLLSSVEKRLPDLRIEPYYQKVAADIPRDLRLTPLYFTGNGLAQEKRELITDEARWQQAWSGVTAAAGGAPQRPPVDFRTQQVLLVSLGEESWRQQRGVITVDLHGMRQGVAHLRVQEQEWYGDCEEARPRARPLPTGFFLVPARFADAAYSFNGATDPCPAQANQP
jgi:hypothetical protein